MNVIINDLYDRNHFESIRAETKEIIEAEDYCRKRCKEIGSLSQDFYSALYKAKPKMEDEILIDSAINEQIIGILLSHEKYDSLRRYTRLDEFASAIGIITIMKEIIDSIPEGDCSTDDGNEGDDQEDGDQADGSGEAEETPEEMSEAISKAIGESCEKAEENISETIEYIGGWDDHGGEITKMPFKEKMALRDKLMRSSKMKAISRMVGRSSRIAVSAQKAKLTCEPEEVCDVELGNDLQRILPCEIALLHGSEHTENEFYRKYCEEMLMQYDLKGIVKEEKGPVVCAVDNSMSMSGTREIWSKALALGLLEITSMQDRKLVILHFGSTDEICRFDFDKSNSTISRKVECAEFFYGGGTDFNTPMNVSLDIVIDEMPKADIVFITDGECAVQKNLAKRWHKIREDHSIACYGVFIGEDKSTAPEVMNEICDKVIIASDILRSGDKYQKDIYECL